jgi:hypothetical protein
LRNTAILGDPYVYIPHEAIIPGWNRLGDRRAVSAYADQAKTDFDYISGDNRWREDPFPSARATEWVIENLKK